MKSRLPGLFTEEEVPNQGMVYGRNKNVNEINEFVKPMLNKLGFDCNPLVGEEAIRKIIPLGHYKIWSAFGKRFEKNGSGNLHKITAFGDDMHGITAQILVLDNASASELGKMAKFDIPANIVDNTSEETIIPTTLDLLAGTQVYMFLYVRPDWFVLIGYWQIPPEGWKLSYRKRKDRKNRMRIDTNYLRRSYKHVKELEKELNLKLKIK